MIKISASTHPAKEEYLPYINEVIKAGADFIHCDVMDGQFVKNTAFSHVDVKNINDHTTTVLDVHLMVSNPQKQIKHYKQAGADILTVHYEAFKNQKKILNTIKQIKKQKMLCGVSIKPSTQINEILNLLPLIDMVLIMSVEPGESGQEFLQSSLNKISTLREIIVKNNYKVLIEVDGGVNLQNKNDLIKSGADILVIGNALFSAKNKKQFIKDFKKEE